MVIKKYLVKKAGGGLEPFDPSKLQQSLINSEASVVLANEIVNYVQGKITQQMTTDQIYNIALDKLKKTETKTASRYSLRRSLLGLGPTGFPFEKFISRVFEKKGYQTKNGITMRGNCIEHEIDVVALKDEDLIFCEIKFHNDLEAKTDTKVALYVKARFDDLKDREFNIFNKKIKLDNGVIITNTKFTNNAKKYAQCVGLDLISWDYPKKGNLYDLIEETNLQPVTSLVSISGADKRKIIDAGLIDCLELNKNKKILKSLGFSDLKIAKIFEEVDQICLK